MSNKKDVIIDDINNKLGTIDKAIILSVKLINKSELSLFADKIDSFIQQFFNIISSVWDQCPGLGTVRDDVMVTQYLILPYDHQLAEEISFLIYSKIQLHIDAQYPESYLKCSIGSVVFDRETNSNIAQLLNFLVYSIKYSKNQGYYFPYEDSPLNLENLKLQHKNLHYLRRSLINKKAKFVYQPIIERETGNISYHECLLRIPNDDGEYISVGPIIEQAEISGLITIVDFVVLEMAVKELIANPKIRLSVNISNIGVLNNRFLRTAEQMLKQYHDFNIAGRLIIEITETAINQDFVRTKIFIERLQSIGCKFALDDFGSGFSSFKQIINLPIDIIKIDGCYIRDILTNEYSKIFVEALIKLASSLKIKTIAEFVENGKIAKFLTEIKIDGMQGNFFSAAVENYDDNY
jgi:EAL domain-containing protein (putative c-di-GMP-specific phosphodiesterase class I)